ncbi:unnamed protein product [Lupinus luteus]|uniref:Uncharacterized protein n=1 Tax=Lupinus luteus TaxID=3873 RepID=A0AAV1XJQ1_LUPLU
MMYRFFRSLDSSSTQEEDLLLRSTKKVKTKDVKDGNESLWNKTLEEGMSLNDVPISYKDELLTFKQVDDDVMEDEGDDDLVENRWYREDMGEEAFDPCPEIPVSK